MLVTISNRRQGILPGMKISAAALPPVLSFKRRDLLGPVIDDVLLVSEYAGVGTAYKMIGARVEAAEAKENPLKDMPRVKLQRSFVMVPGWTTNLERFEALGRHLTKGGLNGGTIHFIKDGQFYFDRDCTRPRDASSISKEARVFEVLFNDPHDPPPEMKAQLSRNFAAIAAITGESKLDVDAYSMGGLGTRLYLDEGGDKVGRLMLLGSPAKGSRFADLSRQILERDIKWAIDMGGLKVADLPALTWLSVDDGKGINNPQLTELNANWSRQKANLEAVVAVGGGGVVTPKPGLINVGAGDGLVPVGHLAPPGETAVVVDGLTHHGYLNSNPKVFQEMQKFFGWQPIDSQETGPR